MQRGVTAGDEAENRTKTPGCGQEEGQRAQKPSAPRPNLTCKREPHREVGSEDEAGIREVTIEEDDSGLDKDGRGGTGP